MDKKHCNQCGITKSLNEFNKNKTKPQGVSSECRECEKKRKAIYRKENPEKPKEYFRKNVKKDLLNKAKQRSNKRGIPFLLEEKDIPDFPDTCPVLGIPVFRSEGRATDNSPSMDRIVPSKGYVRGNVRIISERANRLKNNATAEEMKLVYEDLLKIENEEK